MFIVTEYAALSYGIIHIDTKSMEPTVHLYFNPLPPMLYLEHFVTPK